MLAQPLLSPLPQAFDHVLHGPCGVDQTYGLASIDIVDVVVASLAMKGAIGLGRRPKVLLVSVPMVGKAIP